MPRDARRPTPVTGRALRALAATGLLLAVLAAAAPAAAQVPDEAEPDPAAVAQRAGSAWLAGVQQPDGGYGLAGLDRVETPEAVLAHAGQAQTGDAWSAREAIDGIEALGARGDGSTVLEALGSLARSTSAPVDAAVLITRVALPLGLDPSAFDPDRQGRPVDLVALLDGVTADDAVPVLSEVLTARVALGEDPPEVLVTAMVDARRSDGTWTADPGTEAVDVATTSGAIAALVAAGVTADDPRIDAGLRVLAREQHDDGGWGSDGASRAVDTAAAMGALRAAGYDPEDVCWQEDLRGASTEGPTPVGHLVEAQAAEGNWGRPGEALSTATALQAFDGRWLPLSRAPDQSCGGGLDWPLPAVPPALVVIGGIGAVGTFGAVRILRGQQSGF